MIVFTERVTVNPSIWKTASLAATLKVIGVELELIPEVENALKPSELERLKALDVPVSDLITSANPPLPVVSTRDA